jgi:prefoldin subunit 5
MREQMRSRLTELNRDYQLGQGRLAELERETGALRETLLRIGGAIQVLEELLGTDRPSTNGQRVEPEAVHVP